MAFNIAGRCYSARIMQSLTGRHSNISPLLTRQVILPSASSLKGFTTGKKWLASAEHAEHNHTKIWTAERALSASLLGLLPAAFLFPNPAFDYVAALAITAHIHWGVEAMVVDYIRPSVVGAALAKAALFAVYFLSAMTLGGLFYFNYSDVGLMKAIRMMWEL